ncbi:cobalt-precorrin-8 methylmutase [Methanobacterium sp. ACI-7]|uniref:cobalt-precorrin-8 methylmutase n=1 Tax=unclassified Methanobacterium TaxID=2627676 RepID=UPI0039C01CD4
MGKQNYTDSSFMGASTKQGYNIANKSREIVRSLIRDKIKGLTEEEKSIVERIVHSTADPEYADITKISPDFVNESINAVKNKKNILTDINMVKAGINKYDGNVICYISDKKAIKIAKDEQITRAAAAVRIAYEKGFNGILVVGNAPTALFEAINLVENEGMEISSIIGVPVGFVGAAESKETLKNTSIPYIITEGPKGGTPVAVAAANSIIGLAKKID